VRTKALARRDPYPPAKSEAPQRNTAVTEQAAGLDKVKPEVIQLDLTKPDVAKKDVAKKDTPEEGNTRRKQRLK
jgi:hypothetical protein